MHEDRLQAAHLPNVRELSLDEIGDVPARRGRPTFWAARSSSTRAVSGYIAGETVLVTGGSIHRQRAVPPAVQGGARPHRHLRHVRERRHMLRNELWPNTRHRPRHRIGNVCDEARLNEVFAVSPRRRSSTRPPTSTCPSWSNARARRFTTTCSARSTPCAADAYGAALIFISTDKAVNPPASWAPRSPHGRMVMPVLRAHVEDHFSPCASATCWARTAASSPCSSARGIAQAPHRHPSRHRALLHDHPRGVAPGHPSRRHGEGRRDLHSTWASW